MERHAVRAHHGASAGEVGLGLEHLTFLLAFVGYAGLTTTAVAAAHGRLSLGLWRATALVIVAHVILVWSVRYEWQLSAAVRNGYVGFAVFHAALAMIVAGADEPVRLKWLDGRGADEQLSVDTAVERAVAQLN